MDAQEFERSNLYMKEAGESLTKIAHGMIEFQGDKTTLGQMDKTGF